MIQTVPALVTLEHVMPLLKEYDERVGIAIQHEPPTPRYERAAVKLPYLLEVGTPLGLLRDEHGRIEVAIFAEHGSGRRASGYYACIRFHLRLDRSIVSYAELFCFYDGADQDASLPKRWTEQSARDYALSPKRGFSTEGVPP